MIVRSRVLTFIALVAATVRAASAQSSCVLTGASLGASCPVVVNVQFSVPHATSISLNKDTTSLGTPTQTAFTPNVAATTTPVVNGPVFSVTANFDFQVTLKSAAAWTVSSGGYAAKPISDLQWSTASNGVFSAVSTSGQQVGATRSAGSTVPVSLFFQSTWRWAVDRPGTYSLPLVLTVVAP